MTKRQRMIAVLPTLLTLGNAACGFGAITIAARVGPVPPTELEYSWLLWSAMLVFFGMVFDMLDGSAARLTKQTSEFGAQLDSLCDAISFGVAPAFIMLRSTTAIAHGSDVITRLLWIIAALYVVCVLLRLARFNVETDEEDSHEYFSGLPSPAAAGVVASIPVALFALHRLSASDSSRWLADFADRLITTLQFSMPMMTLAVACLMVSRLRYPHVFNQLFQGKRSRQHILQLVFTGAVVLVAPELVVPLIFGYFAFAAPIRAFWVEFVSPRLHKSHRI